MHHMLSGRGLPVCGIEQIALRVLLPSRNAVFWSLASHSPAALLSWHSICCGKAGVLVPRADFAAFPRAATTGIRMSLSDKPRDLIFSGSDPHRHFAVGAVVLGCNTHGPPPMSTIARAQHKPLVTSLLPPAFKTTLELALQFNSEAMSML